MVRQAECTLPAQYKKANMTPIGCSCWLIVCQICDSVACFGIFLPPCGKKNLIELSPVTNVLKKQVGVVNASEKDAISRLN